MSLSEPPYHLPSGTVTFLFTDIEGSARFWETDPEGMRTALERYDRFVQDTVRETGGTVFKTVGDLFCAVFAAAPDAVAAAVQIQITLVGEIWPAGISIRVRIALHTGLAQERDSDYFGPVLNRVARLLSAGHGGQILLSAPTYELVRDSLPDGVSLRDLGSHRLKDLDRPEHVFQVFHPALSGTFAPLRTLDNTPNNLPQQVTSFIGREKEVESARALLAKTRLLTLTGSGGSGKTRLSLQTAADVLDLFPDGVWLVELAPLSDPGLVAQTVAAALGIKEQSGQTIIQTLTEQWKEKCLLLVLDNCEHLLTACSQLATTLIRSCPFLRILATSREPLGIAGEQTYRVPSLSLPDPQQGRVATPQSLSQFESVRLFLERAQAVKPDFAITNASAPALAQLCWRLDGIPLAIELAAARVRSLSVEDINARLDSRFRLLTGGDRSALPRQQTLRALVDWSYDLLTEPEKIMLARLSVFAGGWQLEAAEAVCGFDPIEDWEVLDLITGLVDKSLVLAEEENQATRYRLLETLRQYGAEKIENSGAVRARHRDYFVRLCEEITPKLKGADQVFWLDRLETEHDNIRTALAYEGDSTDGDTSEPQTLHQRIVASLWRFWLMRGYLGEGREHAARALAGGVGEPATRAKALYSAGTLAINQGDFRAAQPLLEESMSLTRAQGSKSDLGDILNGLGRAANSQGDYTTAWRHFEESLALRREINDTSAIGSSLNNLGHVANSRGDYGSARKFLEESVSLFRTLNSKFEQASALDTLANIVANQGDVARATQIAAESLSLFRESSNKRGITYALNTSGHVEARAGNTAKARALYEESLTLLPEVGDKRAIADALDGLAWLRLTYSLREGVTLSGASDALREQIHAPLRPNMRAFYQGRRDEARSTLGDDAYVAAWEAGRKMTVEQAIEYALKP